MCSTQTVSTATVPLERLEAEITELAGHLAAAECRWLQLVAEYDRRNGYESWGCRSCAHWLSWRCGLDQRAARERVRVARALERLPAISAGFGAGTLSYSKVRALTRIATPQNEEHLVMIAGHATAVQVERTVRAYRGVTSAGEATEIANTQHRARFLRFRWADDGSLEGEFRLPPELGALFARAIAIACEQVRAEPDEAEPDHDGPAGPSSEPGATNGDGLALLAETFLERGPASRSSGDRYQVVVHTTDDALAGDTIGPCELDDGPALAPETVRRLACDASIVRMDHDASGDVVGVGAKAPAIPSSTRRAVHARDRGCRFPGCGARVFVQLHHVRHRARGGTNELGNLLALCGHHHRLVHEGGWDVRMDVARRVVAIRPDGTVVAEQPPAPVADPFGLERANRRHGRSIDPTTCVPRCYGDRLDLDHIVTGLLAADGRLYATAATAPPS